VKVVLLVKVIVHKVGLHVTLAGRKR